MVSFVNFARIASICVGTLHGYFFHQDFWPNLNFPFEYQIKLVLIFLSENFNFKSIGQVALIVSVLMSHHGRFR